MKTQTLDTTRLIFSAEWTPLVALAEKIARTFADLFTARYPMIAKVCGNRLAAAVRIMCTPGACQSAGNGSYLVRSEHNPNGWYQIDINAHTCTCPDHPGISGRGGVCKHRLSIGLALLGPEWLQEDQAHKVTAAAALTRQRQILEAHDRIETLWKIAQPAIDRWEYLAYRFGSEDNRTQCARVDMEIALRNYNQSADFARKL